MPSTPPTVTREQILAFRRTTGFLDVRLRPGKRSLRKVAWAGLQDSMPRAAVLSVNARMEQTSPLVWEDPGFVQVWGPRYSVFVIAARDLAIFTLGRLPDDERGRRRAYDLAEQMRSLLGDEALPFGEASKALGGGDHNRLRYASTTGTVLLRWDGARQPQVRIVPAPAVEPLDARRELVRRYLHVYGPSTPEAFASWAGMPQRAAADVIVDLQRSLTTVMTPVGEAVALSRDMPTLLAPSGETDAVRLLPSGDAFYLLQDAWRRLLVPDAARRRLLWTPRVWPGAILANGEIAGTWRRSKNRVTLHPWARPSRRVRAAVEAEAMSLPLPDEGTPRVDWED